MTFKVAAGLMVAAGLSTQARAHCSSVGGACPSADILSTVPSLRPILPPTERSSATLSADLSTGSAGIADSVSLPSTSLSAVGTPGVFDIRFDISGGSTAQQSIVQQAFENSASFWESVIVGYQDGVTLDGIEIDVNLAAIDDDGGVLGSGGFTNVIPTSQAGFTFATDGAGTQIGTITLDTADLDIPNLQEVVNHEVAHTLGFGTLWTFNGVYINDTGEFTGENGIAAFQDEFDSAATFVPIELDGGPGTANGHLDENLLFNAAGDLIGVGLTGITDQLGRDLANELLTGVIGPDFGDIFLSNTTVATFADIGFEVVLPNVIPEPGALVLLTVGGCLLAGRRRQAA